MTSTAFIKDLTALQVRMPSFPDRVSWDSFRTKSLIIEYQKYDHLYDTQHELYRNKKTREETLGLIADALNVAWKGTGITCIVDDIKKKLNGLRSQYLFERQKIAKAALQGQVYTPTIYWYPMLKFLESVTLKTTAQHGTTEDNHWGRGNRRYVSAFIPQSQEINDDIEIVEHGIVNLHDDDHDDNDEDIKHFNQEPSPSTSSSTTHESYVDVQSFLCEKSTTHAQKRKLDCENDDPHEYTATKRKTEEKPEQLTKSELTDHLETFGKFVANELRGIFLSSNDIFLRRTKRQLQQVLIDAWTQIDMDVSRYPGSTQS